MTSPRSRWLPYAGVALVLVFPWLPFVSFSVLGSANLAAHYAMVAISLVVLVGWVGQISLGHAGLVGIGAYVTGHVVNGWHLTFPVTLLWSALAGGVVAALLGAVAVRVRGLYLAVATLIFSWTAVEFLFRQDWLTRNNAIELTAFGKPGTFPYFDWSSRRTYYYAAWACVAIAIYLMANLRDSKTGRAFFAVRGSEVAAASMGINVVRTKLLAFAVSGALAGTAGGMLIVQDQVVTPDAFKVEVSLFFLAIAVVGGLSSMGGAVAAALLFASLDELFFRLEFLSGWLEVIPPLLLTSALLLYRGGLAAIPGVLWARLQGPTARLMEGARAVTVPAHEALTRIRSQRASRDEERPSVKRLPRLDLVARLPEPVRRFAAPLMARRVRQISGAEGRFDLGALLSGLTPAVEPVDDDASSSTHGEQLVELPQLQAQVPAAGWRTVELSRPALHPDRDQRRVLLEAHGVTVRFGGLTAVKDVSLTVREHEIVGLIGPNGAGKTTTFNSIAGLNVPAAGRVSIYGHDVTTWNVDERARLGIGRTFQAIQLLPQLTVFDNLLVATHLQNPSGFVGHLVVGPATLEAERTARQQVRTVAALLELDEYLDRLVADLPFGVLRMVELARAVVTGSRVVMLDEPASGLDSAETDRLAEILRFVRNLGVTLLLIEHDVRMVTSVSDYIYVLDHGSLLAEGTSAQVQRDPRVIAAYLGKSPDQAEAEAEMVAS